MPQLIIGLIILGIAIKYWYMLLAAGVIALLIKGIVKLSNNWSTPGTQDAISSKSPSIIALNSTQPGKKAPALPCRSDATIFGENAASDMAKISTTCAYCRSVGQHDILKVTDGTIDFRCFACGKNFFIQKSATDYQAPLSSTNPPYIPPYQSEGTPSRTSSEQTSSATADSLLGYMWTNSKNCRVFDFERHVLSWYRLKICKPVQRRTCLNKTKA